MKKDFSWNVPNVLKMLVLIFTLFVMIGCNSCTSKKPVETPTPVPTDSSVVVSDTANDLVVFKNANDLQFQLAILKQFDSLTKLIKTKDSLLLVKNKIPVETKSIYSTKYTDSVVQSNKNLRNVINHQNTIIKNLQKK